MPYRKSHRSKKNRGMKRYLNNTSIMSKLMKMNTADLFYGVREVNELEVGSGKNILQDNVVANEMPLHIYPLYSIINNSVTPGGMYILKTNGHDFTKKLNVEFMGAKGSLSASPTSQEVTQLLHRYVDARFLLWSDDLRKTVFRIQLIKIFDEDLNPTDITVTDVDIQKKRKLFYYYKSLRSQLTSPIIKNEVYGSQLKGKYKIIWTKDYGIDEKLNDRDEHHYQEVRLFRKTDDIKHYREFPQINNSSNDDNPDIIKYEDFLGSVSEEPLLSQRLYLMITANTTLSQGEDGVNYYKATYDINIKNKYSSSERVV